jgi:serine/threonine protein phosphatase 1
MGRTLVLGDLHGNIKALEQVLERAKVTKDDKLIFLGDYVDGWPFNYETVKKLLELQQTNDCIFIMGNHDEWCQNWLNKNDPFYGPEKLDPNHAMNGGKTTFYSFENAFMKKYSSSGEKTELYDKYVNKFKKFFNNLRLFYVDDQNRIFVHGGLKYGHEVDLKMTMLWDRRMCENAIQGGRTSINNYKEIYIGHTGTDAYGIPTPHISVDGIVHCLDQGGGFMGKLSIMDVDTKEFWQSDDAQTLYPDIQRIR